MLDAKNNAKKNLIGRVIMKAQFFKISSVLTVAMILMAIVIGNAFGFGLKSITGGKQQGKVDVDALVDNQANLCKRLYAALGDINKAQQHFAKALGDKEAMEKLLQIAATIKKGNIEGNSLKNVVVQTGNVDKSIDAKLKEANKLDDSKKRELQKGLLPYAKGTAHSVLLGKEFADHLSSTKDAVKQAGLTGALSVKKKLAVTLSVGPKVPKLGSSLLTTANTAMKIAKKAKLDVSEPEKLLADL
jgi:hypothetical protein